jgi:hypothetical protein
MVKTEANGGHWVLGQNKTNKTSTEKSKDLLK